MLTVFTMCAGIAATAQSKQYDVAPVFPGGNTALQQFLMQKLKYPEEARKQKLQGKVILGFMVDPKGNVGNIVVLQHVHAILDSEAVRVARAMPRWTPAKKGTKNVQAPVSLPIIFTLKK